MSEGPMVTGGDVELAARIAATLPPGQMRETESGLIVPESTRVRRVASKADRKALDKAARALASHSIVISYICPVCRRLLERVEMPVGFELRCSCRAVVFNDAV